MKLNNKGWGLSDYLIIVAAIIIALFGASILIIKLSNGLKENIKTEENIDKNNSLETDKNDTNLSDDKQDIEPDNDTEKNINYEQLEEKITDLAIKYIEEAFKNSISNNQFIVDNKHLLDLDSSLPTEMSKDNCKGYVLAQKSEDKINYTPYLKCDNYTTQGINEYYIN